MWTKANRLMDLSGSAMVSQGSGPPPALLRGVLVQPYVFQLDSVGTATFQSLDYTARTDDVGDFAFTSVPVTAEVETIESDVPPYGQFEITRADSLPDLAFRIFVESEVLDVAGSSAGTRFTDIYDEREAVDTAWVVAHPERVNILLTGSAPLVVLVPEGVEAAIALSGIALPTVPVPPDQVHFLRIGLVIRQEIGELGDTRGDYAGKTGYFTSSDSWAHDPPQPSFFGGHVDAPFGRTLQIGGHFGASFLTVPRVDNLYYHVDFSRYASPLNLPYDPLQRVDTAEIVDPLFNKRYLLPHVVPPRGQWQTLHLGPFDGTITAVAPGDDPALVGTTVKVYKRPGLPVLADEYWPFWDLLLIWDSQAAADELVVLTIEVYERTGGTENAPELTKLSVATSINSHLPLLIDNRAPVPKFHAIETGTAHFGPKTVGGATALNDCGFFTVAPSPPDRNECLTAHYSIEDGSGNAHPHAGDYSLWVEYSPRGSLGSTQLALRSGFTSPAPAGYPDDIRGTYAASMPPIYPIDHQRSVLVPVNPDGWPPEPNGDTHPDGPCPAYGAEVSLGCTVRTVDGWSGIFGHRHVSRHIIIRT